MRLLWSVTKLRRGYRRLPDVTIAGAYSLPHAGDLDGGFRRRILLAWLHAAIMLLTGGANVKAEAQRRWVAGCGDKTA